MIISKISPARMLEIQIKKAIKTGYVHNAELSPQPDGIVEIETGEKWIAKIVSSTGQLYYFTSSQIIWKIEQDWHHLTYESLNRLHWISDSEDFSEQVRLKQIHYDRLVLERHDGERVVLDNLGQVAFAFIKFFNWLLIQERRDSSL